MSKKSSGHTTRIDHRQGPRSEEREFSGSSEHYIAPSEKLVETYTIDSSIECPVMGQVASSRNALMWAYAVLMGCMGKSSNNGGKK